MSLSTIKSRFMTLVKSTRGHSIVTFLIFLLISATFWFFMAINEDSSQDYTLPIVIEDLPEDMTLLNKSDLSVDAVVKINQKKILANRFWSKPKLKLRYSDFKNIDNSLVLNSQQVSSRLRDVFGNGAEIISVRPDSIRIPYTMRPGDRLPLIIHLDAQADARHIVYGDIKADVDSVVVYSPKGLPSNVLSIHTEKESIRDLSDSTTIEMSLVLPAGARAVPPTVKVTIPVEPLISKTLSNVKIDPVNVPSATDMAVFPATAEVSFLVPMSMYNDESDEIKATADYRDIYPGAVNVPVTINKVPPYYRNISVRPDKVEFAIKRH